MHRYNETVIPICPACDMSQYHHPYMAPPRPEPYYGTLKIVEHHPTDDNRATAVRYADGRYDVLPNACLFEPGTGINDGPRCQTWDNIRGDISDSEGMDFINFAFNNSDCGATF